jgi:hypothetical protein
MNEMSRIVAVREMNKVIRERIEQYIEGLISDGELCGIIISEVGKLVHNFMK